jgi:hypothetical protein
MYYSPTPHQAHNPNNYGRALMSASPQAITQSSQEFAECIYTDFK